MNIIKNVYLDPCLNMKLESGKTTKAFLQSLKTVVYYRKRKKITSMKYVQEARGCFGVAMRRTVHGYEGVKAAPFNYSSRWIVGIKNYQSKSNEEIRRVKQLKGMWRKPGEGYPQRYPLYEFCAC